MRLFRFITTMFIGAAITFRAATAHADAESIIKHSLEQSDLGQEGANARMTMTVFLEDGTSETRTFEVWSKRIDSVLKTVIRFKSPPKLTNTAFLLVQRPGQSDEQSIYLPAYKKTRRITTSERQSSFAGSDLTYADLDRRDIKSATYKMMPEEDIGSEKCNVIEATPTSTADLAYSRILTWVRKTDDVPLRTQFFGKDGKLEKTVFTKKLSTVENHKVVTQSRVERPNSKRATELTIDFITFSSNLPDSMFTSSSLESGG